MLIFISIYQIYIHVYIYAIVLYYSVIFLLE